MRKRTTRPSLLLKSIPKELWLALFMLMLVSCRDPFEPEVTEQDLSFLVVEGFVETNGDLSTIVLSRTVPVAKTTEFPRETGAALRLYAESGESWDFIEGMPGEYTLNATLDINSRYRLDIRLRNAKEFSSDWITPVISPEISNLGFSKDQNGVEIYVSTQGNENAQYFYWTYEEHWIFRPGVRTVFIYNPATKDVEYRSPEQQIDRCWNSNRFSKIILQNASKFENNTILQRELVRILPRNERLMERYSILVKQMAIDQATFDFWEILRKNTDDIGGIFSPLPSLIRSNINPISDPDAGVIGFVNMGRSSSKRLYIDNTEVAPWTVSIPEYEFCRTEIDTVLVDDYEREFASGWWLPSVPVVVGTETIGFNPVKVECADCTLRGTNVKPAFWED